jgi:hypothetical protein
MSYQWARHGDRPETPQERLYRLRSVAAKRDDQKLDARLKQLNQRRVPPLKPEVSRLLRVESDYFVAGALFNGARCVRAAPILHWMVGKAPEYIKAALLKMEAAWTWLPGKHAARQRAQWKQIRQ